jgi:hypothetical protein
MKQRINCGVVLPSFIVLMLMAASTSFAKDPAVLTLHGEIMDSQCGFDVHSVGHSHDAMTKKGVFGTDAKSCTAHCVKEMGGVYVLVVKDDVYKLDDQIQPEQFAGKKVKLTGTLDDKAHKLHIMKIEEDTNQTVAPSASH